MKDSSIIFDPFGKILEVVPNASYIPTSPHTHTHTLSIPEPIVQQLVLYISVQCGNMCQTGRADVVFFQVQRKWNRTS